MTPVENPMSEAPISFATRRLRCAQDVQRRLVAHIASGGTTDCAAEPMENDARVYFDVELADQERYRLFAKLPLLAALSQDIPAPNDCILFEELGHSAVIIRGHDGKLRGFRNMCTHRGSKLIEPGVGGKCSSVKRFICPFHAWNFDLEGRLAGIPGKSGFDGIDLEQRALMPIKVSEIHGMVFIRFEGDDPLDVSLFLGSFAPEVAQLELQMAAPVQSGSLQAATNWKCALDTYMEGYHFAALHASTIGQTHYSNVAVFDAFALHWRMQFPEKNMKFLVGLDEVEWPEPDFGGVHFLFPNTVIVVGSAEPGKGFIRIFRIFPDRIPGSMFCRVSVYAPGGVVADDYRTNSATDNLNDVVTQEDYSVAVSAYANLLSAPPGFKVVYGRNEIGLQAFHRSLAQFLLATDSSKVGK